MAVVAAVVLAAVVALDFTGRFPTRRPLQRYRDLGRALA